MKVFRNFATLAQKSQQDGGSIVTVGVFDGLHLGHQALIRRAVELARAENLRSIVVTFRDHPLAVLAPPYAPLRLLDRVRKYQLLADMGVNATMEIAFSRQFADTPPERFLSEYLAGACRARRLVCGYDFSFGQGGAGTVETLRKTAGAHGLEIEVFEPVNELNLRVKSTMIRDLLFSGDVQRAARLLTRPHQLCGTVVTGFGRGRTLGFPTANIQPPERHVIPARGVYLCLAQIESTEQFTDDLPEPCEVSPSESADRYPYVGAMVNIGLSPTFGGQQLTVEAHLLDFHGDLAGKALRLSFLRRLRDERKFDGPAELVEQLHRDRELTRTLLADIQPLQPARSGAISAVRDGSPTTKE